jgi:hypothetical protein
MCHLFPKDEELKNLFCFICIFNDVCIASDNSPDYRGRFNNGNRNNNSKKYKNRN